VRFYQNVSDTPKWTPACGDDLDIEGFGSGFSYGHVGIHCANGIEHIVEPVEY
jgi:hypothetical protein